MNELSHESFARAVGVDVRCVDEVSTCLVVGLIDFCALSVGDPHPQSSPKVIAPRARPAQSVRIPPGSTTVTLMPRGPTSFASTSENPPTALFAL
jgi:hypothetical protein